MIRRRLAATNPIAFEPDLARSLWCHPWVCEAGRLDLANAVRVGSQAVTIYEHLAERWPDAFRSDLTAAWETVGKLLDRLGTESV